MNLLEEIQSYSSILEGSIPNPAVERAKKFVLDKYPDAKIVTTLGNGSFNGHVDLVVIKKLAEDAESSSEAWLMAERTLKNESSDADPGGWKLEAARQREEEQPREQW